MKNRSSKMKGLSTGMASLQFLNLLNVQLSLKQLYSLEFKIFI